MSDYEDMDEELRRILDEGSASAQPAELADLRASIPPEPMGEELPKGTKVVFAEDMPVAAPPPSRTPITPKVVDVPGSPDDDFELAAAKAEDRQARSREAIERGTRQLIGGLTRTEALPSTPGPTDAVEKLLAKRKERDARAAQDGHWREQDELRRREIEARAPDREAVRVKADAYAKSVETQAEEAERRKQEAERRGQQFDRTAGQKDTGLSLEERRVKLLEERARKPPPPKGAPKGFPAGWELEGDTTPTPKQGEEFEGLVYSGEKMRGMTKQMRDLMAQAGVSGRVLPGPMQSKLRQLATEIMIEGKNVADLGALSGPDMGLMEAIAADPTKAGSFMKDMPGLLDGLNAWADNSVNAKAKSLGARRKGGGQPQASAAPRKTLKDGRVVEKHSDGLWYPVEG